MKTKKEPVKKYSGIQWEYLQTAYDNLSGIDKILDALGEEGWKLVSVVSTAHPQSQDFAFFKREKK